MRVPINEYHAEQTDNVKYKQCLLNIDYSQWFHEALTFIEMWK